MKYKYKGYSIDKDTKGEIESNSKKEKKMEMLVYFKMTNILIQMAIVVIQAFT